MRRFELVLPESVEDCIKILAQKGAETKLLAGGTDGGEHGQPIRRRGGGQMVGTNEERGVERPARVPHHRMKRDGQAHMAK